MRLRILSLIATISMLPAVTTAANLSYQNVDFAIFLSSEIDAGNADVDGDGFQLRGTLPIANNFFAFAEFQVLNYDFDVDVTRFAVGGGGHWPLSSTVDIIARLGVSNIQVDVPGGDDDDTGLFVGGRIRALITPQFELEGGVEFYQVEAGAIDDETALVGEARYHFNSQWSAGVLVSIGSDTSNFGIHGRFSF